MQCKTSRCDSNGKCIGKGVNGKCVHPWECNAGLGCINDMEFPWGATCQLLRTEG